MKIRHGTTVCIDPESLLKFVFIKSLKVVLLLPVMLAVRVCCTAKMFLHIFFTPFELIFLIWAEELMRMAATRLETPSNTYLGVMEIKR